MIEFGSVCSGIEAASVAWHPLGWRAAWLSEIEPFPCAVLAHHYPDTPNLGDMRELPKMIRAKLVKAPDVFTGGTPCQAFSVAGLRKSLEDDRGNLSLTFVEIADAVDDVRNAEGRDPCVIVWENVPGVLSTADNAFGCFLGALAGSGCELQPPRGRWQNAGVVLGPRRAIAWRILDAQFFGLAQRRKRVFVVASAMDGFDPGTVLLEFEGLRRDSAPRREAGEGTAACAAHGTFECGGIGSYNGSSVSSPILRTGADLGPGCEAIITMAHGQGGAEIGFDRGPTLTCNHEAPIAAYPAVAFNARQDPDHWLDRTGPLDTDGGTQAVAFAENSRAEVRLEGGDGQRRGALSTGGGTPGQGAPMVLQCSLPETLYNKGFNAMEEGNASTQETYPGALLRTLRQEAGEETFAKWGLGILDSLQQEEVLRQALHGISIRPATFSRSWVVCCALGFPVYGSGWLLQSLREAGCERCSSQGWEPSEQLAGELGAYLSELSRPGAQAARFMRDLWFASEGFGLLQQALLAVQEVGRPASRKGQSVLRGSEGRGAEIPEDVSSARMQREAPRERVLHEACAAGEARDYWNGATEQERSGQGWVGEAPLAVRRLIVEECEFLQGFPRGYSKIPWRNKPASECPDGPRYKALGNSWAVPVVAWLGKRIDEALRRLRGPSTN